MVSTLPDGSKNTAYESMCLEHASPVPHQWRSAEAMLGDLAISPLVLEVKLQIISSKMQLSEGRMGNSGADENRVPSLQQAQRRDSPNFKIQKLGGLQLSLHYISPQQQCLGHQPHSRPPLRIQPDEYLCHQTLISGQ